MVTVAMMITPIAGSFSQSQTWTKISGTSSNINKIFFPKNEPEKVVVSSDRIPTNFSESIIDFPHYGIGQNGFQISNDSGRTFSTEILKDFSVYDFLQNPTKPSMWFASVRKLSEGSIAISTDDGLTWDENNLKCNESSQILSFATVADSPNKYFTASVNTINGLKLSSDDFTTCLIYDQIDIQARDIKISPLDNNLMFIGGDNSVHHVYHSNDGGKTWIGDEKGLSGLRILCLMPSSGSPAVVYCGADSINQMTKLSEGKGIFQSLDTGRTWTCVGAKGAKVFSLAQHPKYPKFLAAACDTAGVFISGTFGWEWEQFKQGFPDTASVRNIGIPAWDSASTGILVFAGAFSDGLYVSKRIKTELEEQSPTAKKKLMISSVAPNPSEGDFTLKWLNSNNTKITITISDEFGCIVACFNPETITDGDNFINFNISSLTSGSGLFLVTVSDGINSDSKKLILIR